MLARLERWSVACVIALGLIGAAGLGVQSPLRYALVVVAVIPLAYVTILGIEFALLAHVNQLRGERRASLSAMGLAWLRELRCGAVVFCLQHPFRSNRFPDFLHAAGSSRGIVFVHGFMSNRGFWNTWLPRLRTLEIPHIAVNLEPIYASMDEYIETIDDAVRRLSKATGQRPVVVAHSMGGVATRAWLAATQGDERIHHVVTIGSPHKGTLLARFSLTVNARQMSCDNPWLKNLADREPANRFERFTCFYSNCDNVILPSSHATLDGADNRHLPVCPHIYLASRPEVIDEALRRVSSTDAGA